MKQFNEYVKFEEISQKEIFLSITAQLKISWPICDTCKINVLNYRIPYLPIFSYIHVM